MAFGDNYKPVYEAPTLPDGEYLARIEKAELDVFSNGSGDEYVRVILAIKDHPGYNPNSIFLTEAPRLGAIKANGHTEGAVVVENKVDATCSAEGHYDNVVYCSVCKAELSRNTVTVEKVAHTEGESQIENNVDPTCTVDGHYDEVTYCTVCGVEIGRKTVVVSAKGHTAGEAVVENNMEPDCENDGSYDNVVYCTVCEAEVRRDTVTVDALGHAEVIDTEG